MKTQLPDPSIVAAGTAASIVNSLVPALVRKLLTSAPEDLGVGEGAKSIEKAEIDDNGHLVFAFSDGSVQSVGDIRGKDGRTVRGIEGVRGSRGQRGKPGNSIQSLFIEAGVLYARISDGDQEGETTPVGKVVGPPGPASIPGPCGAVGSNGPRGVAGEKGLKGERGVQGVVGKPGPRGLQGDAARGTPGSKGDAGIQGFQGDTGLPGAQGVEGPQGKLGPRGPAGIKGLAGVQGESGEQGLKGDPGIRGEVGIGKKGPAGKPGPDGKHGDQGTKGAAGFGFEWRGKWKPGLQCYSQKDQINPARGQASVVSHKGKTWICELSTQIEPQESAVEWGLFGHD